MTEPVMSVFSAVPDVPPPPPEPDPLPLPAALLAVTPGLAVAAADAWPVAPGEAVPVAEAPAPVVVQESGEPAFWHLVGYGASLSRMSCPLTNVGLSQVP